MKLDVANLARLVFSPEKPWPYEAFEPAPERPGAQAFDLTQWRDLEVRPPNYLIADMLEAESFACLFGMSGGGKSFMAIDWALSLASGTPWHGRAVKQAPVVYINGEGQGDLTRRLEAWGIARKVDPKAVPFFLSRTAAQLSEPASLEAVTRAIEAAAERVGDPGLIVLDTLARNAGGIDENSAKDMGQVVRACDHLRETFAATVLLVHHSGKNPEQGARGSSALRAAVDTEFHCNSDRRGIRLGMTKSKSGPLPDEPLRFRRVESGQSAVLEVDDAQGPAEPGDLPTAQDKLSKGAAAGLAAFQAAARKNAADADGRFDFVSLEAWRVEFYAASTAEPDAQRKAFGRAREDLVKAGRLAVDTNVYSLTNGIEAQYLASSIRAERTSAGIVEPVQVEGDPEAQGDPEPEPVPDHGKGAAAPEGLLLGGDPEAEEIPDDGKTSSPAPEAATLAETLERLGKVIKSP